MPVAFALRDMEPAEQGGPPFSEHERLSEVTRYAILDTPAEEQFDRIAALARVLFDTPIAAITLVDQDRQWFKSQLGLKVQQTPRVDSFCNHAMENEGVFVVADARADVRFAANPLVTDGPHIRFYAGAPLRSSNGANLGAVCVISDTPREDFTAAEQGKLQVLASIVETEMELRLRARVAHKAMFDKDMAMREAHSRIKNSLDLADLLSDLQSANMTTEKLSVVAMAAWKQYSDAGTVLSTAVRSLRARMPATAYRELIESMPGFSM
jgi:GAF domain-containing protein